MARNTSRWQPWSLVLSLLVAALLFVTYLAPVTSALWHVLDVHVAFALNSMVASNHTSQLIWSFGNLRISDYIIAVIMLAVIVHYVVCGSQYTKAVRAAQATIICVMLVVLASLSKNVLFDWFPPHDSPSLVLHPFTLLSHTNSLDAKDSSSVSFPGDHATVVATFVYLLWAFAGWRYGFTALIVAIIACLPRLVAGAHWLTDDLVGGLGAALLTVPWVIFTPIGPWLVDHLSRLLAYVTGASICSEDSTTR